MDMPRIALGAWAWGNDGTFGGKQDENVLKEVFDTAMDNGLYLWDTAYAYGAGQSEKVLGRFIKGLPRSSYMISDKLTPQMMPALRRYGGASSFRHIFQRQQRYT